MLLVSATRLVLTILHFSLPKIDSIAKHSSSISSLSYFAPTAGILPLATDTISLQYSLANKVKHKTLDTLSYRWLLKYKSVRDDDDGGVRVHCGSSYSTTQ